MKQLRNLDEANRYLSRFYQNTRAKYTLDNMRTLMDYLDQPQEKLRTVHIAGTSGKTSTAYYMSALLTAGGAKTGLSISPHVDGLNERLQINGEPLAEADFCKTLSAFLRLIKPIPVKPSWFELMAAFAYWYFAREKVNYAVIEVGLGGLHDGTNVITRPDKVCIITDIGLDHTDILGKRLSDIAAQKAGIIQPGNAVFTYKQAPVVMKAFKSRCDKQHATLHVISDGERQTVKGLPAYQRRNWQLAHQAYEYLSQRDNLPSLTSQALDKTRAITIPGRMDIRRFGDKTIIMDGAHNAQKMETFLDGLQWLYPKAKLAILLGLKDGKDYQGIVPLLAAHKGQLIITGFAANQDTPIHSMNPAVLAEAFQRAGKDCEIIAKPTEAFEALLSSPERVLVVTGSFYLLSQIRNNGHLT